jgi:putative oxidoreductase
MNGTLLQDWRYLIRFALGALFIWAALAKIADVPGFVAEVHNFRMVPVALENIFAMTLPWIELIAGVALILNLAPRSGLIVLGGLLVVFFVAILSAIIRNLDISCGCFGTSDASRTGWITLIRDVVFLAMAFFGWPKRPALDVPPLDP